MILSVFSSLYGEPIVDATRLIQQGFVSTPSGKSVTGTILLITKVHSISQGLIIDIGQDPISHLYSVTVEYSSSEWFRYCELQSVDCEIGDGIIPGQFIGIANHGKIRFEYCTLEHSTYIVRLGARVMYKQDPLPILYGEKQLFISLNTADKLLEQRSGK